MEIKLKDQNIPFNLEYTLDCGQLFRWKKIEDWWYGQVEDQVIKIKQKNGNLIYFSHPKIKNPNFVKEYLRLDDNLLQIRKEIEKDQYIKKAVKNLHGLRLCRQDPWECLISYICATFKNILAIKKMIKNISRMAGKKISFDGYEFYTFPKPDELSELSSKDLRKCGLGFRAERVLETAKFVTEGKIDFESLKKMEYLEAKDELLKLPGVGHKVADCTLLFSLEKLEAFPIDVWIKRAAINFYPNYFEDQFIKRVSKKSSISPKEYKTMKSFGRKYFGKNAGYAQEYLFHFLI